MRRLAFLLLFIMTACAPSVLSDAPLPITVSTASPAIVTKTDSPIPVSAVTRFPNPESYQWKFVAGGFDRPLDIQISPDGSGRLFIVEQGGLIRILLKGQLLELPFLDISRRVDDRSNEQGLLGLAFHPDFLNNGYFFVNYTERGGDTVIARFSATGDTVDPNSEMRLLSVKQPFSNHNGGGMAFGPDGYLYIALGDGGSGGDPQGNGQNLQTLLGKILRIDVDGGDPYTIPSDNPFGNEIFHYGLRNPWRFSFDSATGDLWIGDVGQGQWEEVDFVPAGVLGGINFGWNRYEGLHDYTSGDPLENHRPPLFEYSHQEGCSVTGGYVYRGMMPEWQGVYFYGDFCVGTVWGALPARDSNNETWVSTLLFRTDALITSFGVDDAGEIYLADRNGSVFRLERR